MVAALRRHWFLHNSLSAALFVNDILSQLSGEPSSHKPCSWKITLACIMSECFQCSNRKTQAGPGMLANFASLVLARWSDYVQQWKYDIVGVKLLS